MDAFTKLPEFLKLLLLPRIWLPVALVTLFLLFSPSSFLARFGLESFVLQHRWIIGLFCLSAVSVVLSEISRILYQKVSVRLHDFTLVRSMQKQLRDLTPQEKSILQKYIESQKKTAYFDMSDGAVNGLVSQGVLYRSSDVVRVSSCAYNIQPWAWEYLNKNHDLLK